MILRTFGWSFAVTAAALALAYVYGGINAFTIAAILAVLEISLSFDNAVVNATVLDRMNAFWQKLFLTVGILIAVFGMRLLFPLLIVGITANLSPAQAVNLALNDGARYGEILGEAHPAIAGFGGMFLLMLFLDFIFEDRDITWLDWIEKPLARIGKLNQLPVVVGLVVLAIASQTLATGEEAPTVLLAGILGAVTYIAVKGLGELFEASADLDQAHAPADNGPASAGRSGSTVVKQAGKAAFFLFLYLEVLDASFSFDGVIGAFAVTSDPIIIAIGLGIGAMYIRSLTVFLVRKGTLGDYVYLEHGAHWAIGALAALLFVTIKYEVPEIVTGLIGVGFILAAFVSSLARNKRHRGSASGDAPATTDRTGAPA